MKLLIDIDEQDFNYAKNGTDYPMDISTRNRILSAIHNGKPYKEQSASGSLTSDERRLIGVAVDYLLGAELLEENGWSENDIKVLQSLCERYYDANNLSEEMEESNED